MIKKIALTTVLCASLLNTYAADAVYQNVVPLPRSIVAQKGKPFTITAQTPVVYAGTDSKMKRNAEFLSEYIGQLTGLKLAVADAKDKKTPAIVLALNPKVKGAEAYRITVAERQVTIEGSTAAGVFYGIQTLRKSMPVLDKSEDITLPATVIADEPRFGYRGMMLDSGRHFWSVDFVKKYIDIMALHNMNTFHWHLSEDQGWRIEIKKYPKLTEVGSIRKRTIIGRNSDIDDGTPYGGFYTQDEAREVVRYAAERNITVIPEIDMPGHMLAALAAYPELGCTGGPYEVGYGWGVFRDVLCLGNEKIYEMLEDVVDELTDIFPASYFHIGGDETPTTRWEQCPKCQAVAKANGITPKQLQEVFTNRMEKYINSKGRRIIGWDEITHGKINQSATIMSWQGVAPGSKAAEAGHDVIMSPNAYCYFDHYQTDKTWNEPLCIGGNLPIAKTYQFDAAPDSLSSEAKKHILGVQANLWTEYIGNTNMVEYQILPRMGALAEVQWMPVEQKNFDEFVKRETQMTKIYDKLGYKYAIHLWPEKHQELGNL